MNTYGNSSSYGRSGPTKSQYGNGTFELRSAPDTKRGCGASDVELVEPVRRKSSSSMGDSSSDKERVESPSIQDGIVVVEQTFHVSSRPLNPNEVWESSYTTRMH